MKRRLAATAAAPLCFMVLALTYDEGMAVGLVRVVGAVLALADLALVALGLRFDRATAGTLAGVLNALAGLGGTVLAVSMGFFSAVGYSLYTIVAGFEWGSFCCHPEREYMGLRTLLWAVAASLAIGRAALWAWETSCRATTPTSPDPS